MLCQDCPKRNTCTKLCEKAEKYVSKDHVSMRESTHQEWKLELLNIRVHPEPFPIFQNLYYPFLTPLQNRILNLFYVKGLTYKQIARAMSGNRSSTKQNQNAVRSQLARARKKIRNFFSDYRRVYNEKVL